MILAAISSSDPLPSWGWPFAAALGGGIVFIGLLLEKTSEWLDERFIPGGYKPHKTMGDVGWTILMVGILAEMVIGCALAAKDEQDINAAKNAARNAPISDMSATAVLLIKGKDFNALTNWDARWIARMTLCEKDITSGLELSMLTSQRFDILSAENFLKDEPLFVIEPQSMDVAMPCGIRFRSFNFRALHGRETPVKAIDDVNSLRMDINFLPRGTEIDGGAVDLVANNIQKRFVIFPQMDTNLEDGTPGHPYIVYATNADESVLYLKK